MYTVITHNKLHDLITVVNNMIKEGWKPLGGVVMGGMNYYQAMTKDLL